MAAPAVRLAAARGVRAVLCVIALVSGACGGGSGGGSPVQPTPVVPPPPASTAGTLRGTVSDMLSGAPLPGATLAFAFQAGAVTVTAGGGGAWEVAQPQSSLFAIPVEIWAPGYVTRNTFVRWQVGTREHISIDLIRESAPFHLDYYRALVRNLFSAPDAPPEPIRRWTEAPGFYINAFNPSTGTELLQSEIDVLVATIRVSVPQLSGGQFGAGAIEVGSGDRPARRGEIKVHFIHDTASGFCGRAYVGANPGEIELNYGVPGCGSPCGGFAPRTVAHEVGHAMGFFHVAERDAVLSTTWFASQCGLTAFSAAEQHHARVAYGRAPGNRDPDMDPAASPLLQGEGGPPIRITCR